MTMTLNELLAPPNADMIRAKIIAKLQLGGLPTTDWESGSPERAFLEMYTIALLDLVAAAMPKIVGGGYIDYATGPWLTLNAKQRYNKDRLAATVARGSILLTNTLPSAQTLQPDTLWFRFPSGNLYRGPIAAGAVTLAGNGAVTIIVESEQVNHSRLTGPDDTAPIVSYNDPSNALITMITPLPGVIATNPAPGYSTPVQRGVGPGTILPSGIGLSSFQPHTFTIRIDFDGLANTAVYSYSVDGGPWVSGVGDVSNAGGTNVGWSLSDPFAFVDSSFLSGDTYTFSTPGTWISQAGVDEEIDEALRTRAKASWPSLATQQAIPGSPTLSFYDLLARQPIPPATTSPVTQTLVQEDDTINDQVNIYVAGNTGALPSSAIIALQAFFDSLNMITDKPLVLSPVPVVVTLGGLTIYVSAGYYDAAQAAIQRGVQNYIAAAGLNASASDFQIDHAEIVRIVKSTPGVVHMSDTTMTINGAVRSLALPTVAGQAQLPVFTQNLAASLGITWVRR